MPLRRRDGGDDDRRTFELVETAGGDDDLDLLDAPHPVLLGTRPPVGASPGPVADDPGDARPPGPDRRRRRLLVGAAVGGVILLVAGMLVVDAVTTRDAQQRLETARGAVRVLDGAPEELWTATASPDHGVGFLPGLLVTVAGGDAVALDLDGGETAWSVPVGDDAVCGSWSPWDVAGAFARTLVCLAGAGVPFSWSGPDAAVPTTGTATVTVLDAAGEVLGHREVELDGALLAPGPAGGLVRVERVGEPGEPVGAPVAVDPGAGETIDGVRGRDAVVTLEDALTGDVRWRHDLPFQHVPWSCTTWDAQTGGEQVDAEATVVSATETMVDVAGCGLAATFSPSGDRLDDPDLPTDGVVPLAGGGFLVDSDRQGSTGTLRADRVLRADGTFLLDVPGEVLDPQSTDDPDPGVLLVRDGIDVRAYDDEGARLWTYDGVRVPEAVYALAGGTAVVGTGNTVVGLDAMTGEQTWSRFVDDLAGDDARSAMVTQSFTDGRCVILALVDPATGLHPRTVALELSTGSVVWESDAGGEWASFLTVQGRLLRWDGVSVSLLG